MNAPRRPGSRSRARLRSRRSPGRRVIERARRCTGCHRHEHWSELGRRIRRGRCDQQGDRPRSDSRARRLRLFPKTVRIFLLVPPEVAGSLLVFTASFMTAGGMQIVLTRPLDTRATYVIGVSSLLGLSRSVFPNYFLELSPATRSFTDSSLALGLTSAIVLTLVFRLGTHQRAEIGWSGAPEALHASRPTSSESSRLRPLPPGMPP